MVNLPQSKVWVAIATFGLIGQVLVMFLVDPAWVSVAALAIAALVGASLFRGSRIAWTIAVISAGGQLGEAVLANQPLWLGILNSVILGCLFVPQSLRFVWRKGQPDATTKALPRRTMQHAVHEFLYRGLAVAAGWEASFYSGSHDQPSKSLRTLTRRLGLATLGMLLLVGLTYSWQQSTGDDVVPDVVADVVWTAYAIVQIALLVVVLLAVIRHFSSGRPDAAQKG